MAIVIFADGASSGNPGPAGWGAIVVETNQIVNEIGGGSPQATNNQMELMAVIEALEVVKNSKDSIDVHTDSTYVIKGIQEWVPKWKRIGWKTVEGKPVLNQALWERLEGLAKNLKISWKKVLGHSGVPGNERVDEIATAYCKGLKPKLYSGPLSSYGIDVNDLKSKTQPKGSTYSYLSLVSGIAKRHKTWAECEQRVKGAAGAKFKKTTSPEEELMILKSWGVDRVS